MADFTDILSQYASNKLNQFTQPFTDPNAYFARQLGVGETEEERRRRLEREARERAAAEAVPVTQTIKTNPVTGEQEMTIKGSPQDLSADNPFTPTVTGPVAPTQAQPQVQPMEAPTLPPVLSTPPPTMTQPRPPIPQLSPDHQAAIDQVLPPAGGGQPQAMPAMAPPAPVAGPPAVTFSDIPGQEVNNGYPTMPRLQGQAPAPAPAPAPVPAPVAPMAMPAVAPASKVASGPVDPNAPPAPAPAPKFNVPPSTEQMGPSTQFMDREGWEQRAATAKLNQGWDQKATTAKTADEWESLAFDNNAPTDIKRYAAQRYAKEAEKTNEIQKANKVVDGLDSTDIGKYLTNRKEKGSLIKAILYQRLGFQKQADIEMSLYEGDSSSKLESMLLNGQRYTVETNPRGGVTMAFDSTGKKVDDKTLSNINANFVGMTNSKVFGEAYVGIDSNGNKRVYSKNAAGVYVDDNGRSKPQDVNIAYKLSDDPNAKYDKSFMGAAGTVAGGAAQEGYDVGGRPTPPGATISGGAVAGGTTTTTGGTTVPTSGGKIRNNNPGNIRYGQMAIDAGATGKDDRGFAIFPDEKSGFSAQEKLWTSPAYKNLTLSQGISKWAPNNENNPAEYLRTMKQKTSLDMDKEFKDLTPDQKQTFLTAQAELEHGVKLTGAKPGVTTAVVGGPAKLYLQKQEGERKGKRSESFDKIIDEEYRVSGQNGEVVSNNRKQQFDILNRVDPTTKKGIAEEISGLYTAANENPRNQKLTILRDILTGKVVPEKEISNRIAELNISPAAKSALLEYNSLNAEIAAKTLKETAGAGAVSDAEQAANRARNVDITKTPMLGAYNMMAQSQFKADLARYKADRAIDTTAANASVYDRDFRKDQAQLIKDYREITEARLNYINENGGATNPAAIRDGYKKYPVPQYDPDTGGWKYRQPLDKIFK